jgi:hypothetical protein
LAKNSPFNFINILQLNSPNIQPKFGYICAQFASCRSLFASCRSPFASRQTPKKASNFFLAKKPRANVDEIDPWCSFSQR